MKIILIFIFLSHNLVHWLKSIVSLDQLHICFCRAKIPPPVTFVSSMNLKAYRVSKSICLLFNMRKLM